MKVFTYNVKLGRHYWEFSAVDEVNKNVTLPMNPRYKPKHIRELGIMRNFSYVQVAINWMHIDEPQWTTLVFGGNFYTFVLLILYWKNIKNKG